MIWIEIGYLLASILFILGIRKLTKVKTARDGNILASFAMFIAVVITLVKMNIEGRIGWGFIIAGIIIGGLIGAMLARRTQMTAMPQLVAFFNGMGGGASIFVALSYYYGQNANNTLTGFDITTVLVSVIIGTITLTGSLIAYAKLQQLISGKPILFPGSNILNIVIFLGVVALAVSTGMSAADFSTSSTLLIVMTIVCAILGILLVTPIGGADMPVVISLLNSYSGLAAAATGFVLKNNLLIISGALVGASGLILTQIMCKAMNRSLTNVLFGGFGQVAEGKKDESNYKNIKEIGTEEAAMMFDSASNVIIVPGYGMAVAQAQHAIAEMTTILEKKGVNVVFAIHPVAGRMPGHMNVLLAEANIPYEKLKALEDINHDFQNADVVLIIGANDVVNPAASKDKGSPIYGMPILNAHEAKSVIVVKRSLSPGFAGIKNELFEYDNVMMLFSDAKKAVTEIVHELKEI